MLEKIFSLGLVITFLLASSPTYAGSMDEDISKLLDQVERDVNPMMNSADKLYGLLQAEDGGTWSQHQTELTNIRRRVAGLNDLIPEPLRDGGYTKLPMESVWMTQVVAILESLDFATRKAMQVLEREKKINDLLENADYRRNILVIHDFIRDIQRMQS